MKILVTGRGTSGSWKIRGEQLGRAIGATVEANAVNVTGYDVVVVVKRPRSDLLQYLRDAKVPIVWDVVDAWPQPVGNDWDRKQCMVWLKSQIEIIRPVAVITSTRAMDFDLLEDGIDIASICIQHHARPEQAVNPIREKVETVGYEGGNYLGKWLPFLAQECSIRGWKFIVNPPQLADLDIVVAIREPVGYAARRWKSNVKLANAQGSGTPIICNRVAGYFENGDGALWADTEAEMHDSLEYLSDADRRRQAAGALLTAAPRLEAIAENYKRWLARLKF